MTHGHALWQRVFKDIAPEYPGIEATHFYVDALAMFIVLDPGQFQVIVTNNLFGDIVTDLGAALQGGLGMAASGNIHPGRTSMFEPVHGSAPKLAGKNVANPFGAILSTALMLETSGLKAEADASRPPLPRPCKLARARPTLAGHSARQRRGMQSCGWFKGSYQLSAFRLQ